MKPGTAMSRSEPKTLIRKHFQPIMAFILNISSSPVNALPTLDGNLSVWEVETTESTSDRDDNLIKIKGRLLVNQPLINCVGRYGYWY